MRVQHGVETGTDAREAPKAVRRVWPLFPSADGHGGDGVGVWYDVYVQLDGADVMLPGGTDIDHRNAHKNWPKIRGDATDILPEGT